MMMGNLSAKSYLVIKPIEVAEVSVELVFRVLATEMQRHDHKSLACVSGARHRLGPANLK